MHLVDHETTRKDAGSIWLTHKRLTHDGEDLAMKHENEGSSDTREYSCLVQLRDGHGTKFSTKVDSSQLLKFQAVYGSLLKASMTTLRKRDKKRERTRQDEATKRRQKMTAPIILEGHKRGKGRRQRQRKLKALVKQQDSQKKFQEREEERKKADIAL
ncbi:hypothetical protein CPB83DRAFT_854942 [Crepidotus variabilis]|uniref:Signal recognition particle subunit SRP14 n=1 Tax=Crepidotus variabilis TaxID=179855 RepID=A0A9P6EFH1_9AGAR|nr:hypothetical protein CPB83DRAFT_854942 [Crepidotus variabilis]